MRNTNASTTDSIEASHCSRRRHGGDKRGSAESRRRRKFWLLGPDSGFGGDGTSVMCWHGCGTSLCFETVEADRIVPGGSYRRENVAPACRSCNLARSDNADWTLQAA